MTTFASDRNLPEEPAAPPKSARRRSREFILQGLYQWRVGGADEAAIEAQIPEMDDFAKADREFFVGTLRGVIQQQEKLSGQIRKHIDREFSELSPVEACILMMGAFELNNHPETPYRVIINEAIELAKYVNGVLDKVAALVRPEEFAAKKQAR